MADWIKEYTDNPKLSLEDGCFRMFYAFALLEKVISIYKQKMKTEIMIAYVAFRRQVELTYFMSVSLFAMGILARLQYIIQDLLEKIQDAYQILKDSSVKLPSILSLEEFMNWNSRTVEEENQKSIIENCSSTSSSDNESKCLIASVDKSCLSDEFWSKSESGIKETVLKKRKRDDVRIKSGKKSLKNNDLDMIFGRLK